MPEEAGPLNPPRTTQEETTVQALFGDDEPESDDPFNQLSTNDSLDAEEGTDHSEDPVASTASTLELGDAVNAKKPVGDDDSDTPLQTNGELSIEENDRVEVGKKNGALGSLEVSPKEDTIVEPVTTADVFDEIQQAQPIASTSLEPKTASALLEAENPKPTSDVGRLLVQDDQVEDDVFAQMEQEADDFAPSPEDIQAPTVTEPQTNDTSPKAPNTLPLGGKEDLLEKVDQPEDDIFAQIEESNEKDAPDRAAEGQDPQAEEPAKATPPKSETKPTLDDLFSDDEPDDPFAQLDGAGQDETPLNGSSFDNAVGHDVAGSLEGPLGLEKEVGAQRVQHERDFSDLLAEFEDGDNDGFPISGDEPGQGVDQLKPAMSTNLFADLADPSPFDELNEQGAPSSSREIPSGSNGHDRMASVESLFPDSNIDFPFGLEPQGVSSSGKFDQNTDGDDPIPFDIPLGWYDDAGVWNWYTDEEKEQVRLSMLGQDIVGDSDGKAGHASTSYAPIYSPNLGGSQSENAARRTPQPEASSARFGAAPYDPYSPQASSSQQATPSPYALSSSASSSSGPYDIQQRQPSFAPSASPYDPYAPSTTNGPANAPYGIPIPPYGSSSAPASATRAPVQAAERPAPPKRIVSNAYDPPLRPQKSFVRPPSAMATSSFSSTPAPPVPPMPAAAIAQSAPAPPPSGPPRRSKTPSAPAFVAPPSRESSEPAQSGQFDVPPPVPPIPKQDSYNPPDPYARPPSQPNFLSPPSQARPLPPRNQSYNTFDPPLRPASAARARAGPERSSTPPISTLAPPPATAPPQSGPPRGPSRGAMKKSSMMFEARPSFEARPPSRSAVAGLKGTSPLVAAAEIPSRPSSQPRFDAPEPSGLKPPVLSAKEEYDPEGGEEEEDQQLDSPYFEKGTLGHRADDGQEASSGHGRQGSGEDVDAEASHTTYSAYAPPQTTNSSHSPYAVQPNDDYQSPARQHQPYNETPRQEQEAQSSYDPSPYQGQSSAQSSSYDPPPQLQASQYRSPLQDSNGLGLSTTGSPPAESRSIYNPYAPTSGAQDQSAYAPYAPTSRAATPLDYGRLNSSYDPYAPTPIPSILHPNDSQPQRTLSPSYGSDYGVSPPQPNYFQNMHSPADTTYTPQQVLDQKPISEDPLGRSTLAARNAPLAVFGFGGVLISAFPAQAEADRSIGHNRTPSYGYASGRGQLWIRTVSDLASSSALKPNDNVFPGPLVSDPSTPKGAAGDKKKREAVTGYLQARAEEIEKGLPYLKSSANATRREEEGKLVIVRILAAMILGDGKLSGKTEVEDALRAAFSTSDASAGPNLVQPASLSQSQTGYSSENNASNRANPHNLIELAGMLAVGDKREAAQYAARRGLWSHALVISSSVDPELWSEMVMKFAEAELQNSPDAAALRAAYTVFSGRTATSVDDLVASANLSGDPSQDKWREVVSAVVFNGKPVDLACLDELGARFKQAGLNYPAHVCHLLSPTSPFSDSTPTAIDRPIPLVQSARDEDAIIFAEIAEYARSLVVLPKGQESPVSGLPQLLPYKLQRAWLAAELGEVDQAKRYCTAIGLSSKVGKNGPSVLPPALSASLEDLNERLTGTPSTNPARLIGGQKSNKAGLGSWIEGRLSKFIAGEEDGSPATKPAAPAVKPDASGAPIGPFSHFSTISPAASGDVTRNTSTAEFAGSPNSRRNSPLAPSSHLAEASTQSAYGDYGSGGGYNAWSGGQDVAEQDEQLDNGNDDEGEFINPMAALSIGGSRGAGPSDYQPQTSNARSEEVDDDEDLGFGNASLSRGRTPRPAVPASEDNKASSSKSAPAEENKAEPANASPAKAEPKGGWLKGWWGKKEGQPSGPVVAKLGEESSMVFDKELKRWVVKGAKPEPVAAAPPPPPRAQTASPSHAARPDANNARASSATPPPSQQARSGPPAGLARSTTAPMGFTEMPDGQIKRQKSSLAESITADAATPGAGGLAPMSSATPPAAGPPGGGPPGGPPKAPPSRPATASIDDLLSRPPSKRPGSAAAKKSMRNKYVDILQPGTN